MCGNVEIDDDVWEHAANIIVSQLDDCSKSIYNDYSGGSIHEKMQFLGYAVANNKLVDILTEYIKTIEKSVDNDSPDV